MVFRPSYISRPLKTLLLLSCCPSLSVHAKMVISDLNELERQNHLHLENLWLLCGACNSMKGTGTVAELRAKLNQ